MPTTIATVNVNGIRAATRKGMLEWLEDRDPDIITLQEVRAPDEVLHELFADRYEIAHDEANAKGRAGVAIMTRRKLDAVEVPNHAPLTVGTGRWIEAR
ncbi:endonuclease/exonuclease/phosphatase family protein, partial [Arthrospira platensis SPKY2]